MIAVQTVPAARTMAAVRYRWDEDTDILTAEVGVRPRSAQRSLSVDVEGNDGSWLSFDVADGQLSCVEVAVWPPVRKRTDLVPPPAVLAVGAQIGTHDDAGGASSLELEAPVYAESDGPERTLHFRLGVARQVRTVQVAREILLDIDSRDRLAGLWLLNVPPYPGEQ